MLDFLFLCLMILTEDLKEIKEISNGKKTQWGAY